MDANPPPTPEARLTDEQISVLITAAQEAAPLVEWCPSYCSDAIRHVERNCDIECGTHPDGVGCEHFGKYDGAFVAAANPKTVNALAREVQAHRAFWARVEAEVEHLEKRADFKRQRAMNSGGSLAGQIALDTANVYSELATFLRALIKAASEAQS